MSEIKPKKERRFLKTLGRVGEILVEKVLLKLGSNLIKKIGGKKTLPSILFLFLSLSLFAQFPNTLNKQRLGFQTTGDGLTWRGSLSDTASIQPINNTSAWVIIDTINLKFYTFDFTSNVWNLVGGSAAFTQPVDSLFFNTGVPTNNVDTAKMRWDSDLATVVLGLNDNVPNELGFKNFWLVKNQTGSTITKGSLVYANGTVGASGRITVDKFIANGSIDAKYLLGITAHDLTDGEDGYVISFGKIRQVDTDTFAAGAILYPSPTVAGVWTDVEPIAPNLDMPIGFCINSSSNNGTIAIRVASGYKLSELHDVSITSPVEKASLYYSGGLWRDTTATLLVSDTAAMLANYATKEYADTTGRLYARQDFTNVETSTLTWTQTDTLIPGGVTVVQVYRNGQILLPSQYTIPTSTSVIIAVSSFKVNDNYTVIFPRGGGAGSGEGSGSLTSISGGTGILVSPDPITTTGTVSADLSVLMELTDTSLLNLTSRLATKLNISDTAAMLSNYNTRINSKLNISDTLSMLAPYFRDADTSLLNLTSRFALKLNAADTASLSSRIDAKGTGTVENIATGYGLSGGTITTTGTLLLDSAVVFSQIRDSIVDVAIGNDTIKILKQEYAPATTSVLTWTVTSKFPIQLKAYILVFRNGQLLINDQYNLTDTNQITIVSNSFKVGSNYTVVTVSGIGSVGTGVFPNPVYPEAGIAVSTGSAWASSVTNNSANWNIAFNDKITNAAFSGTTTKTLTLTQYDGGTFTPTFTDLQGIVAADTASMLTPYLRRADTSLLNLSSRFTAKLNISDTASMLTNYLRSGVAASTYQTKLTNPVTGTGTNNYIPKFTTTGSTIGNSTLIDNGTTISTSSILSTTNYASFNTTQVMSSSSGILSTHRFTSANANGVYDKDYFLTSYMGAPWQGSDPGSGNRSKPPIVAIINNTDSNLINSGLHLMTTKSQNNVYTPALTFGVNSENGVYYNTIGAITAKKLNTGQFTSQSAGQLEFFGTGTALDATGASMTTANMTLGVGVGIGYTTAPTVRGRLTVLEKLGINQPTPAFALDVNGTANITGAVTLSETSATPSTLLGKSTGNVVGNVRLTSPLSLAGDSLDLGTVPISKGGTGAESASVARITLGVGYTFFSTTTGATIIFSSNRVSLVITGTGSTTTIDLTTATNGRQYMIKNLSNATVISSASNVIPLAGGSAGTAILSAGNVTPQWVTLVADGTNWHVMQSN